MKSQTNPCVYTLVFSAVEIEELINGLNWAGNEGQDTELADPLKARLRAALEGSRNAEPAHTWDHQTQTASGYAPDSEDGTQ